MRITDWLKGCLSLSDGDLDCGPAVGVYNEVGKVYASIYGGQNVKPYTQALHCNYPIPFKRLGCRTKHQGTQFACRLTRVNVQFALPSLP